MDAAREVKWDLRKNCFFFSKSDVFLYKTPDQPPWRPLCYAPMAGNREMHLEAGFVTSNLLRSRNPLRSLVTLPSKRQEERR